MKAVIFKMALNFQINGHSFGRTVHLMDFMFQAPAECDPLRYPALLSTIVDQEK